MSGGPTRVIIDNATGTTGGVQASASVIAGSADIDEPRRGWRAAGPWPYQLVVILWFLGLFAPFKLIPYYIPPTRPLSWLPELLLWLCAIQWIRWPGPKHGYPAYTGFMLLMIFGTGVAFMLGNWGVARETIRYMYQDYLLGLITLTFCTTLARARPLLGLYFGSFLWYGLWGLISLKTSPLSEAVNPGARRIIAWHPDFDNRDAFGPLMVAGFAYSIYYLRANRAVRTRVRSIGGVLSMALSLLGFITSFGRGAFLGFLVATTSMWLRSRRKLAIVIAVALVVVAFSFVAPQLASKYLATMQSITGEGMEKGTGADRAAVWSIAWREFLSSPIVGVGTADYGPAGLRVLGREEIGVGGYTRGSLFERVPHSAPMRILAEYGLVGVVIVLVLVVDFFRTNRRIRRHAADLSGSSAGDMEGSPAGYVPAVALGLRVVFLTFCVSSIFYELLYSSLFWNVIVLNRMLYIASGAQLAFQDKRDAR